MRIAEEIDALESMAVRPIPFVVSTRVVAAITTVIPLYIVTLILGFFAAKLVVTQSQSVGGTYDFYFNEFLKPQGLVFSLIKVLVFVVSVVIVHSYQGYYATGGAEGVGRASGRGDPQQSHHHRRGGHDLDSPDVGIRLRRADLGIGGDQVAVFQDPSGRAPSRRSLIVRGLVLIVVGVIAAYFLIQERERRLHRRVDADDKHGHDRRRPEERFGGEVPRIHRGKGLRCRGPRSLEPHSRWTSRARATTCSYDKG